MKPLKIKKIKMIPKFQIPKCTSTETRQQSMSADTKALIKKAKRAPTSEKPKLCSNSNFLQRKQSSFFELAAENFN